MANEYLKRTPTSTGNRKVWTFSCWAKISGVTSTDLVLFGAYRTGTSQGDDIFFRTGPGGALRFTTYNGSSYEADILDNAYKRDGASWMHVVAVANTPAGTDTDKWHLYVNGVRITDTSNNTYPSANLETNINNLVQHYIGAPTGGDAGQITDLFFVDGQALTPDVFGYYKKGDGYISAGSTQATDFKKGQWVPKAPKVIKSVINARGGFGSNGFYLPMNDSTNFGADFHRTPNTMIKLNGEDEPQPYYGAPTTTDAYVSQLRDDPYKDYLVLAIPGIKGGRQNGYGDYSADIKGSGTNKVMTAVGGAGVTDEPSFYGSAISIAGSGNPVSYIETPASPDFDFNADDFTVEFWEYRDTANNTPIILDSNVTTYAPLIAYTQSGEIVFYATDDDSAGSAWDIASAVSFGPAVAEQWNHVALCRKGTQFYLLYNGVVTNEFSSTKSIYQFANKITIGRAQNQATFDGKIQDLRVYKGVAKYTSGFDVPKPYTPVGIGTWRAVPDTTTNNFATLNPLHGSTSGTYTNGNLTIGNPGTANIMEYHSTIGMTQGKWYCEARVDETSGSNHWHFGISSRNILRDASNQNGSNAGDYTVASINSSTYRVRHEDHNAVSYDGGSPSDQLVNGDIVGVAVSITTPVASAGAATTNFGTVQFYRNGSTYGNELPLYRHQLPLTGVGGTTPYTREWFFAAHSRYTSQTSVNFGQNPTFSGNTTAGTFTDSNGKGLFKYQPPTGFLALCEDNLPTPAIADPGKYFKSVLWRGDDSDSMKITGVGFKPDLVWVKKRTGGSQNHTLYDSVRGADRRLMPNATNEESSVTDYIRSFDNDGFSIGGNNFVNDVGQNYVAWCWQAGAGTTSTNTDGSINSVVSVNQDAGFSIVSYTGNLSATGTSTIGHGLGKPIDFVIVKSRTTTHNWNVMSSALSDWNQNIYLNLTNAATDGSGNGSRSAPTSTVFSVNYDSNQGVNGTDYIAYCWTEIEGFSKFGSYIGNASADGPFVYCGFKPAFVLLKPSSATGNWTILDSSRSSTNPVSNRLHPNLSDTEYTGTETLDLLSNGFKIRRTGATENSSGETYIFAAFAESPLKTANAK